MRPLVRIERRFTAHTEGQVLHASDGRESGTLKLSSAASARAVCASFLFWGEQLYTRSDGTGVTRLDALLGRTVTIEQLVEHAVDEVSAALRAQAKRRFRTCFPGVR